MYQWLQHCVFWRRSAPGLNPGQHALDELAAALHTVRGKPRPRRIVNSTKLPMQFPADFTSRDWRRLELALDVVLPPLRGQGSRLAFPEGWETVFDVAFYLAARRREWGPPQDSSLAAWRNAQVFVGVRECLVES